MLTHWSYVFLALTHRYEHAKHLPERARNRPDAINTGPTLAQVISRFSDYQFTGIINRTVTLKKKTHQYYCFPSSEIRQMTSHAFLFCCTAITYVCYFKKSPRWDFLFWREGDTVEIWQFWQHCRHWMHSSGAAGDTLSSRQRHFRLGTSELLHIAVFGAVD